MLTASVILVVGILEARNSLKVKVDIVGVPEVKASLANLQRDLDALTITPRLADGRRETFPGGEG
jgi:hypothetical protein